VPYLPFESIFITSVCGYVAGRRWSLLIDFLHVMVPSFKLLVRCFWWMPYPVLLTLNIKLVFAVPFYVQAVVCFSGLLALKMKLVSST
jgi:hypothetical protein